nr:fimbrillin family protein [Anaerolineae bacterium]
MSEPTSSQRTPSEAKKSAARTSDSPHAWLDLSIGRASGRVPHIVQLQRVVGNRAVLQMVGRPFIQRAHDSAETDDSDHGLDSLDLTLGAEDVSWWELTDQALRRRNDRTLGAVFFNMIPSDLRVQISQDMLERGYYAWKFSGVFTRERFRELVQQMIKASNPSPSVSPKPGSTSMDLDTKRDDGFIQTARTGNTYSVNSGYTGKSNAFGYDNVVYLRDGGGNINFSASPTSTVTGYNGTETPTIDSKDIKWSDPMDYSSLVQMSND